MKLHKISPSSFGVLTGIAVLLVGLVTAHARAQSINIDGSYDAAYGSALATQTVNTQFGDNTDSSGSSSSGSELDAAYAYGDPSNDAIDILLTGNLQNNGNHLLIFFDDGRPGGQTTLNAPGGSVLANMNGSKFESDFQGTYVLDFNNFQGTLYLDAYDLVNGTTTYEGSTAVGTPGAFAGGITAALNDTNTAGVGGGTGAADQSAAQAVTTGLELSIPMSLFGNPTPGSDILFFAMINGGGNSSNNYTSDSYASNQFLGGLPPGTDNLGAEDTPYSLQGTPGGFDLSGESGEDISLAAVPEPGSLALLASASGIGALIQLPRRRRTSSGLA